MLTSMTGFGKREGTSHGLAVTVEVRSVNHRFREIVLRVPKGGFEWEEELKELVARTCRRGRIELVVVYGKGHERGKHVTLDRALARHYYRALKDLQREFRLGGTNQRRTVGLISGHFSRRRNSDRRQAPESGGEAAHVGRACGS